MVAFVLDGSVTLAAGLPDEVNARASAIIERVTGEKAAAPIVWPLEVANGFLQAQRQGRIPDEYRLKRLAEVARLPVVVDLDGRALAWTEISRLAAKHRLTAYDAAYLELAIRLRLPIATFDRAIIAAATLENVEVL